ncbi:hypothetical protein ADIARSV_3735 [Arcticibacter svalbardensis MN12-7]|uniref:Uncharacterized protein n=1 Tax=Arcticibacter svalbardensis MN12-7 TaxID=1150600 RepID=R9GNJ6_9SPHI|nr:hypothetical protein [Arcticibacter svalbardensis]EOR93095.1 hypothetical protein ADIARSV_3735 [Arcticibacter svalbardensis MN12-7]
MGKSNLSAEADDTETALTDQYQVNTGENDVKIHLITGDNGQTAVSKIRLNEKVLIPVHLNSLEDYTTLWALPQAQLKGPVMSMPLPFPSKFYKKL